MNNLMPCTRCDHPNLVEEDHHIETADGEEMFVCGGCVVDTDKSLDPYPWEGGAV